MPPHEPALDAGELHVWWAELDACLPHLSALAATLAPDERERAGRFAFPYLRQRFVVARGLLRAILARYLRLPPQALRFGYTAYGKPFLLAAADQPATPAGLNFNLAHSDDTALYAVALDRAVGVDVERLKPGIEIEAIAAHQFASAEYAAVLAAPPEKRLAAFYRCWTRKEAFIKAHGAGLSLPLKSFEVSVAASDPPRLVSIGGSAEAAQRWSLWHLDCGPAYAAALVAEGTGLTVRQFRYPTQSQ